MMSVYITALLMGLAGSLHCAGMCGPIMLFLPFHQLKGAKKVVGILLYHFARVSVYAGMAVVLYSFRELFNPRVQQYVSMTLGATLLLAGLLSFLPLASKWQIKMPWSGFVTKRLGSYMANPGLGAIAASGLLNGLLPCGLVYMALSATLALPTTQQAVTFTYFFGIGTMPMLIGLTFFRNWIVVRKGLSVKKFTPAIVFVFGCIFFIRGLNLGIPYLSPKTQMTNGVVHSSCCHKK
jgi:sulfite exporter TauE/SafE